mmetsp:Transcript_25959/g.82692  ORF Transcript_25959/g.82692 Transcript_25959/m.82692 type:complete len:281 (+) Transcript_25959:1341-2183(+)
MALKHPSFIYHEDVFVDKKSKECVFLMEQMGGGSLQDHLMSHPNILSSKNACKVFKTLLLGLSSIHARDICHCDIKPDNILLREGPGCWENAKLSDFGLAVRLNKDHTAVLNRVRGTEGFIAPELYRSRMSKQPVPETPGYKKLGATDIIDAGREGDRTPRVEGGSPAVQGARPEVIYTTAVDIYSAGVTLYSTLGGNWQKPIRQVSKWEREGMESNKYLFANDGMWSRVWISDGKAKRPAEMFQVQDLIRWMLHPIPALRPTAEECLRHPWLKLHGLAS